MSWAPFSHFRKCLEENSIACVTYTLYSSKNLAISGTLFSNFKICDALLDWLLLGAANTSHKTV